MKLAYPVNEGWLFSKDKNHVKVFASYDKDADSKEITFGDRTMIPWACVKKMTKRSFTIWSWPRCSKRSLWISWSL